MLSDKELKELKEEIVKYKLDVPDYFRDIDDDELKIIYNGAGSDDTPAFIRWILSCLLNILKASILIHDVDFTYKKDAFEVVNKRSNDNNLKLINGKVSKWNFFYKCYIMTLRIIAKDFVNALGKKW